MPSTFHLIGRGVYTLREAERLTGVPRRRIRRWTQGYEYVVDGKTRRPGPVIQSDARASLGSSTVDFADLIEVRFLNAFREHGVSWRAIRVAAVRAREMLDRSHPFSSRQFKTDGRTILAEFVDETGDPLLVDLVRDQVEFSRIVSPPLYAGLEYDGDELGRWWPLGPEGRVAIDPDRAFGAPVVAARGVPTRVLANAVAAEGAAEIVAAWYRVNVADVLAAVEFETRHAA